MNDKFKWTFSLWCLHISDISGILQQKGFYKLMRKTPSNYTTTICGFHFYTSVPKARVRNHNIDADNQTIVQGHYYQTSCLWNRKVRVKGM